MRVGSSFWVISQQLPPSSAGAGIVDAYEELSVTSESGSGWVEEAVLVRINYHVTYDDGDEEHLYTSTLCALISMS